MWVEGIEKLPNLTAERDGGKGYKSWDGEG